MKPKTDHFLLLLIALASRTFFSMYRLAVMLAVPIVVGALGALVYWSHYGLGQSWETLMWITVLAMLLASSYSAYQLYIYGQERLPESVGQGGTVLRMCSRFITWIGTLRFYRAPWVVVQEPSMFRLKGAEIRALIDNVDGILKPGDILLRGFDGYVDGEFIRRTGGANDSSKYFSHAALYVGPLGAQDRPIACRRLKSMGPDGAWHASTEAQMEAMRSDPGFFQTGPQMVIHSMAKGVHVEDILTFVRCDYLAVLRMPETFRPADKLQGEQPLVRLVGDALNLSNRLDAGETLTRDEVVCAAIRSALGQIGAGYDCLFEECESFHRFSCSEFVYYCFKSVHRILGLHPQDHAIAGLFHRETVSPADLFTAATASPQPGKMHQVWTNVGNGDGPEPRNANPG